MIGITVLGVLLRVAHLTRPFNSLMAWNEGHYAMIALNFDRYGLWSQLNELGVDHTFSPGVPWLIWAAVRLFGPTEWAARLPIVVSGIVAIILIAALVRRLLRSEQIALISAGFVAVAPGLVYFSQNVQLDTPSICLALAGAVSMLRYQATRRGSDFVASGVWLLLAIWFKFTTALLYPAYLALWWPARPPRPATAVMTGGAFVVLTALPSAAWVVITWLSRKSLEDSSQYGWLAHELAHEFYHRPWSLRWMTKALLEIPLAVESHLFILIFILMLVGIPVLLRWRSRLRAVWVWCAPWVLMYLVAPWHSLVNRYYDLPATYMLVVPAALALWVRSARRLQGAALTRRVFALCAIIIALTVAYDLWDPMTDRIAKATMPHAPPLDPLPFYSAKTVARLPRGRTVVDWPPAMFYAGGDPAWVTIAGDVRGEIDSEQFDYVLLNDYGHGEEPYYVIDDALRTRLATHHYVQIAPAGWAHERTAVADLDGRPRADVPYWSPAPAWRLPGMAVWQ